VRRVARIKTALRKEKKKRSKEAELKGSEKESGPGATLNFSEAIKKHDGTKIKNVAADDARRGPKGKDVEPAVWGGKKNWKKPKYSPTHSKQVYCTKWGENCGQ